MPLASSRMRGRVVALLLVAASVASGSLAVRTSPVGGPPDPTLAADGPGVAVLSPRRVPELLRRSIATARLGAGLDAALDDRAFGGDDDACLVVSHRGRTVFEHHPRRPLIPASTQKVLVATAALERIGGRERFTTELRAAGPPRDGVIAGPLWMVGSGDPLLATSDYAATFKNQPQLFTDLAELADQVVAAGVRAIRGGVVGDESRYDRQRYIPTWKPNYITDSEVGPASALVVNDGFSTFVGRKVAASAPATHAAASLITLLQIRGVAVEGGASTGDTPDGTVRVAAIQSAPVGDIVAAMLSESDNLTAELLVKELARREGRSGSTLAGVVEVEEALDEVGIPVQRIELVDGSGLDRGNRATCAALMAAVAESGPDGAVARGLAVANRTGTLARRFVDHPAAGRLRGKTGSLDGVSGLTGFLDGVAGGPLSFALISNDVPSETAGRQLQERVGQVLAAYPDAPPADELAP